jgi:hypothetical protein
MPLSAPFPLGGDDSPFASGAHCDSFVHGESAIDGICCLCGSCCDRRYNGDSGQLIGAGPASSCFSKENVECHWSASFVIVVQGIERSVDIEIHDTGGNQTSHESPQKILGS